MKVSKLLGTFLVAGMLAGCGHSGTSQSIFFESGSDQLSYSGKQSLKKVATMVKEQEAAKTAGRYVKSDTRIRLSGFSDSVGDIGKNRQLAKKRVSTVSQELVKLGINPMDITQSPLGEGWLFDQKGPSNRKDRRVDIIVY